MSAVVEGRFSTVFKQNSLYAHISWRDAYANKTCRDCQTRVFSLPADTPPPQADYLLTRILILLNYGIRECEKSQVLHVK